MTQHRPDATRWEFEPASLSSYLRRALPGLQGEMRLERLAVDPFACAISVRFDNRALLLRKQWRIGKSLPLACAVAREYRILGALKNTDVPVPESVLYCDDPAVLGMPFHLMEQPRGRIFSGYALQELPAAQRRALFFAMAETMARLHRVDWAAAGLADYGRPVHFFQRRIAALRRQWASSGASESPDAERLIEWLSAQVPADDAATIVHADFDLGKLLFDPTEVRVIALLDWGQSTLGHPLADVAHNCLPWVIPSHEAGGLHGLDLAALGIPSLAEYLTHYRQCGGHAENLTVFHLAFALFRLAAMVAGSAAPAHERAAALVRRAVELIDGYGG